MKSLKDQVQLYQRILGSKYFPVGIKILDTPPTTAFNTFQHVNNGHRFCFYVHQAALGKKFLITKESEFDCYTPYICLGFHEPEYADFAPRIQPAHTKAVLIGPLQEMSTSLDTIIFIVNPKQAMLLVGALRRILKHTVTAHFGASMAICGEIIAHTIVNQTPNLSLLCYGARIFSGFTDDELVLGIPFHLFDSFFAVLKNIEATQKLEAQLKNEVN
ncbi:MAG: DUF169 domain-containing protein [Candidatus Helarchaeota archaeon]